MKEYQSKEFKEFISKIPLDTSCKFELTDNLILHLTKKVGLCYIDVFGKTRNDLYLDIIIEDKSNDKLINLEEVKLES